MYHGLTAAWVRLTMFSARFPGDAATDRVHVLIGDVGLRYRIH